MITGMARASTAVGRTVLSTERRALRNVVSGLPSGIWAFIVSTRAYAALSRSVSS